MKYIAVLITVFNRKEQTLSCLKNLFAQVLPDEYHVDVYLTNDGCTDGTPEAIRKQYPQVNIIDGDGTLFWNRGMWTAWDAAAKTKDYDYYLWLNDDTFLNEGAITKLLISSESQNDNAIIVGATVDTNTHKILTYGGHVKKGVAPCDGSDVEVNHFNGNIVLVPKYAFKILGNLDYYYTHSKGDFDYGIRAHKAGIKMLQVGTILGECDTHSHLDKWCDPQVPLRKRWDALKRPNGMPPNETFHLEKQISLPKAILHYFTIYLRCLFPSIWTEIKKTSI